MLLRITTYKELLAFHSHKPMQNISFAVGPAPDQHYVSYRRQGIQRLKLYHVAVMHEGKHTAPRGRQPNVLTSLQGRANDGHQFVSVDNHCTDPVDRTNRTRIRGTKENGLVNLINTSANLVGISRGPLIASLSCSGDIAPIGYGLCQRTGLHK